MSGHSYASSFSHLHDFEPAPTNHACPHYGIFGKSYNYWVVKGSTQSAAKKYTAKDHGPPSYRYSPELDALEHNEILQEKGIAPEEVRHPAA